MREEHASVLVALAPGSGATGGAGAHRSLKVAARAQRPCTRGGPRLAAAKCPERLFPGRAPMQRRPSLREAIGDFTFAASRITKVRPPRPRLARSPAELSRPDQRAVPSDTGSAWESARFRVITATIARSGQTVPETSAAKNAASSPPYPYRSDRPHGRLQRYLRQSYCQSPIAAGCPGRRQPYRSVKSAVGSPVPAAS